MLPTRITTRNGFEVWGLAETAMKHLPISSELASEPKGQRATAGKFALEIMHEIRNPLETLGHLSYLAYQDADNAEQVHTYMRMAPSLLHTRLSECAYHQHV